MFWLLEKEEQELIRELNKKDVILKLISFAICGKPDIMWISGENWVLQNKDIYKINPAYKEPEPEEFEYYEVFKDKENNILRFHFNGNDWSICLLESFTDFITLQSYLKDKDIWFDVPIRAARDFYNNGEKLRAKFKK